MSNATSTSVPNPSQTGDGGCYTEVPGKYGHVSPAACNSYYNYEPNFGVNIFFAVIFGMLTLVQIMQAFIYKKGYTWVVIMGAAWETTAFILRALGTHDQQNLQYATIGTILLILAPLWINAFVYMTLGRMIYFYDPAKKIWIFPATKLSLIFVLLDIVSFLVQGAGGSLLSPGNDPKVIDIGIKVYEAGIGLQQAFIFLFVALIILFHVKMRRLSRWDPAAVKPGWLPLTIQLYVALSLITIRIIYRLAEFSRGLSESNELPRKEGYLIGLEATPMALCLLAICVVFPGRYLQGPDSKFPSRKEKRAAKKEAKRLKRAGKEELELAKTGYAPIAREDENSSV